MRCQQEREEDKSKGPALADNASHAKPYLPSQAVPIQTPAQPCQCDGGDFCGF
jgi:hypothetical protein